MITSMFVTCTQHESAGIDTGKPIWAFPRVNEDLDNAMREAKQSAGRPVYRRVAVAHWSLGGGLVILHLYRHDSKGVVVSEDLTAVLLPILRERLLIRVAELVAESAVEDHEEEQVDSVSERAT